MLYSRRMRSSYFLNNGLSTEIVIKRTWVITELQVFKPQLGLVMSNKFHFSMHNYSCRIVWSQDRERTNTFVHEVFHGEMQVLANILLALIFPGFWDGQNPELLTQEKTLKKSPSISVNESSTGEL